MSAEPTTSTETTAHLNGGCDVLEALIISLIEQLKCVRSDVAALKGLVVDALGDSAADTADSDDDMDADDTDDDDESAWDDMGAAPPALSKGPFASRGSRATSNPFTRNE